VGIVGESGKSPLPPTYPEMIANEPSPKVVPWLGPGPLPQPWGTSQRAAPKEAGRCETQTRVCTFEGAAVAAGRSDRQESTNVVMPEGKDQTGNRYRSVSAGLLGRRVIVCLKGAASGLMARRGQAEQGAASGKPAEA